MRQVVGILLTSTGLLLGACAMHQASPDAAAPAAAEQPPRYTARQFFETTSYTVAAPDGIAFSNDGDHLLISTDATGVFNAYLLPVAGGAPKPVTSSTDNATFGASFFPSDDRVLSTADQGGNELHHLYVREADGSVRDLTPGERLKAGFLGWSADGQSLFVSTNERDPQMFDVYAYDTDDYQRRMIFRNEGFVIGDVSADGRHLALIKAHSSANSDIYLARTGDDTSEPQLITKHEGDVAYDVHGFTPDGRSLIYGTNETSEFSEARAYAIATGEKRPLIRADWDVMFVAHSPTGRYRVHALNEDGSTALTIADTTTGRPLTLHGVPEGNLGTVRFSRDESMIAFTVSSDTSPSDIFVADLASGRARRLTTALNPAIDEDQLVEATVARFPSYDGLEIPGILYRPREASAANPVPGVVLVHGGPGGQSRRGYSAMVQHLVNNGYAVYAINNRGSSGYGKTFDHLDDRRHGDADLRDVTASRDWLASKDWVSDRIAVMGGSYGGYITAAALAFHPDVFDAGINIFGVTNWERTLASIPAWWGAQRIALFDEMGDPAVDAERHKAISPLFHATNIRRPMLVVQGANDPRVLQAESDEIVAAVRANGVPVEYLLFSDEGHGFQKKQNRIDASEAYLRFLSDQLR
ncbi:MAG: alpha/beta fold hydrolase [Thermoanaerobaculia bacterium]